MLLQKAYTESNHQHAQPPHLPTHLHHHIPLLITTLTYPTTPSSSMLESQSTHCKGLQPPCPSASQHWKEHQQKVQQQHHRLCRDRNSQWRLHIPRVSSTSHQRLSQTGGFHSPNWFVVPGAPVRAVWLHITFPEIGHRLLILTTMLLIATAASSA